MSKTITGSLFSGAGLGDLGLEWAGFHHAWFCEIEKRGRDRLAHRWPNSKIYKDIGDIDGRRVEQVKVLVGGFPCTDISAAKRNAKGINGSESSLWWEFRRIIEEIQPNWVIIENSDQLCSRGGPAVAHSLAEIGYDFEWTIINASDFGAPHKRARFFGVAYPTWRGQILRDVRRNRAQTNALIFGKSWGNYIDRAYEFAGREWWKNRPEILRVDDVCPDRMDRLSLCGRGIIPLATYCVGVRIQELERAYKN